MRKDIKKERTISRALQFVENSLYL